MREMKDSGIEWIGKIPKNWELSKIGSKYEERKNKVSDKDYPPLSVTKNGIIPQLENAAKTDNGDNRKLIKKNDFVINSRSDRRGSCGISELEGSCSLINIVLKPREDVNNKYYGFVFKSDSFADEFYRWGHGIVNDLWSTKWSDMKNIYIPSPDIKEQQKIADYLDQKILVINKIIDIQKKIISDLKDYKFSIIREAVTKGISNNVKLKESNVEWIGNIPAHWEVRKLYGMLDSIGSGTTPRGDEYFEKGNFPWLNTGDLNDGYVYDAKMKITEKALKDYSSLRVHKKGAVVMAMYGATIGKLGITMFDSVTNQACCVMNPCDELDAKYLFYLLFSAKDYFWFSSYGAGQPNISQSTIKKLKIPICPIDEQKTIVDYLDKKCNGIDEAIEKKTIIVNRFEKYKQSLIYETVTGKKEIG